MSGGKGGSQTQTASVPPYIEEATKANLDRANQISQLGYTPYFGPDVAAFTPMQQSAFQNVGNAASAYGLSGGGMTGMEGMPQAQPLAGGGYGYSSAPIYEAALSTLEQRAPAQYDFIRNMFINPVTGQRPNPPFSPEVDDDENNVNTIYGKEGRPAFTPLYNPRTMGGR
jgi:hypothetical protein